MVIVKTSTSSAGLLIIFIIFAVHVSAKQSFEQLYAPTDDVQHDSMMGQSVVLECQQGSQIWLEADYNDDCHVRGSDAYRYSSFGGFLIRQI